MSTLRVAVKSCVAVTLASAATLLMSATPASAADWDRGCYNISAPYKGINEVMGQVSKTSSNCEDATIGLLRHRWYGWEEMDWATLESGTATTWWNCAGSGTYTYKVAVGVDYGVAEYESAERRITC
ncbi:MULTISPECIES: hypothetical protein [unclassified Streptomyces]|uniref:hypothetical protein n=1 Tax=unclassified Streptomyces TaxID=2593676 RepID=UPI00331CED26